MKPLESLILTGQTFGAWKHALHLLKQSEEKPLSKNRLYNQLTAITCKHYWWLAGEFFELTGKMGWSAGHREDWNPYESVYPLPLHNAELFLKWYIKDLCELPVDDSIQTLMGSHPDLTAMEPRLYHMVSISDSAIYRSLVCNSLYDLTASKERTKYELGAARPYWLLSLTKTRWRLGLAGLILIAVRGLDRAQVMRRKTKLLLQSRIKDYTRRGRDVANVTYTAGDQKYLDPGDTEI
jgi:hypothetical protein